MGTERRLIRIASLGDAPIACTLSGTEMGGRLEEWQGLLAQALEPAETTVSGARVRLPSTDAVEAEARRLIEAESACCAFFSFSLERSAREMVISVGAPEEGRELAKSLFGLASSD